VLETVLFIPLLASQSRLLTAPESSVHSLLSQWGDAEVAAVALIQNLPGLASKGKSNTFIEQALADLISVGSELRETHPPGTFAALIAARFNRSNFESGLALMSKLDIRFLDEDAMEARQFLSEGRWNFNFRKDHSQTINPLKHEFSSASGSQFALSDQQSRTFRVIQAAPDESIHIQGLAGTGKTHMIERLVESLSACRPLLLTFTRTQLNALMQRVGLSAVRGMTFGDLASHVLESRPGYRPPGKRASARYQVPPSEIASRLGFQSIAWMKPPQVATICARMVSAFCSSADSQLGDKHIPKGLSVSTMERLVLVQYAQTLWDQTVEPNDPLLQLPLRGYHRIKQMTLQPEAFIGHEFTHIIVDEAHDLSWPLAAFLDRCEQPVITLGDACQRLDGFTYSRSASLRQHEITHSIRAGRQIEGVINPLIEKHPVLKLAALEGNRDLATEIVYYEKAEIPECPVTILVDSEWGLFEWFQRLGSAGAKFSLLPGALSTFRLFILDCIGLFHDQKRPTHGALFRYTNWDDLRADMSLRSSSFQRIDRMLAKGYSSTQFEASLLSLVDAGEAQIQLGRVVDARNSEIDTVMLAPDLLGQIKPGDRTAASIAFAALYTGGTRARYRLIVPGYLRDWAADTAALATASST